MGRKLPKSLLAWLIILMSLVVLPGTGLAVQAVGQPDYRINDYQIAARLLTDGTAEMSEDIHLYLLRPVSNLRLEIPRQTARSVTLQAIYISAGDAMTQTGSPLVSQTARSSSRPSAVALLVSEQQTFLEVTPATPGKWNQPLTYVLDEKNDGLQITIHVSPQVKTERIIRIQYRLEGACLSYGDTVLFRRDCFNLLRRQAVGRPQFSLQLPPAADLNQVWSQPVSPVSFSTELTADQQIINQAPALAAGDPASFVYLIPGTILPQAPVSSELKDRTALLADIHNEVSNQAQNRLIARTVGQLTWMMLLLALLLLVLIYLYFDREGISRPYRPEGPARAGQRPAVMALLMRIRRPGSLLLSTLMDLVRRGELSLDGNVFTELYPGRLDYMSFAAYEIFLLQWLFGRVTQETTLSTAQIRKYALDRQTALEFQAYYEQFIMLLMEELEAQGLIDRAKSRLGRIIGWSLASLYLLSALVVMIYLRSAFGLLLLIPAAVFVLYGLKLRHLTAQGNLFLKQGHTYRRFMLHISQTMPGSFQEMPPDKQTPPAGTKTPTGGIQVQSTDTKIPAGGVQGSVTVEQIADALPYAIAMHKTPQFLGQVEQFFQLQSDPGQTAAFLQIFIGKRLIERPDDSMIWPVEQQELPFERLRDFSRDLQTMDSMLSAALYLAAGIHLTD